MTMEIKFRPHHFLCTLCFRGKGYSPTFIANFNIISEHLSSAEGDKAIINITSESDSICAPCPHRQYHQCENENKIKKLDEAHQSLFDFTPNTALSWQEAKNQIYQKITMEKFHQICKLCNWKRLGICENIIKDFSN